jgi:predicted SAM-dependent methyltransferase
MISPSDQIAKRGILFVKAQFQSKWANLAGRIAITMAAIGLLLLFRPNLYADAKSRVQAEYQREFVSPRIIADYLRQNPTPKLQIGAGASNAAGWLNTDIEPSEEQAYLDATKPMPFPDGSLHYIFGEHVIEHLTYEDGLSFLKESHRVLAAGGKVRMVTPNLLQFVAMFQAKDEEQKQLASRYVPRKLEFHFWHDSPDPACFILNNEMRSWGHQFVYTPAMLRASFEKAGFSEIRQYAAGETGDPVLKGLELRPGLAYADVNAYEAMAFEATR